MTPELLRELREALDLGDIEYDEYELVNGTGDVVLTFKYPSGTPIDQSADSKKRLVEMYEAMTKPIQDEHSALLYLPSWEGDTMHPDTEFLRRVREALDLDSELECTCPDSEVHRHGCPQFDWATRAAKKSQEIRSFWSAYWKTGRGEKGASRHRT